MRTDVRGMYAPPPVGGTAFVPTPSNSLAWNGRIGTNQNFARVLRLAKRGAAPALLDAPGPYSLTEVTASRISAVGTIPQSPLVPQRDGATNFCRHSGGIYACPATEPQHCFGQCSTLSRNKRGWKNRAHVQLQIQPDHARSILDQPLRRPA